MQPDEDGAPTTRPSPLATGLLHSRPHAGWIISDGDRFAARVSREDLQGVKTVLARSGGPAGLGPNVEFPARRVGARGPSNPPILWIQASDPRIASWLHATSLSRACIALNRVGVLPRSIFTSSRACPIVPMAYSSLHLGVPQASHHYPPCRLELTAISGLFPVAPSSPSGAGLRGPPGGFGAVPCACLAGSLCNMRPACPGNETILGARLILKVLFAQPVMPPTDPDHNPCQVHGFHSTMRTQSRSGGGGGVRPPQTAGTPQS